MNMVPFRGTTTDWKKGPTGTSASLTNGRAKSCSWEGLTSKHWYMLRSGQQDSSFAGKDLMVQMDKQLTVRQSHKGQELSCIRKTTASSPRQLILPLCSVPVRPHLDCCAQLWASQQSPGKGHRADKGIRASQKHWNNNAIIRFQSPFVGHYLS